MQTANYFEFGVLTPIAAYLMSCAGAFLGLRSAARALAHQGKARLRWLVVTAVSIGTLGIWVMHFIAMLGFAMPGETIRYDVTLTILSMLITVAVVLAGLLIAASGRQGPGRLTLAGIITGSGIAGMHYIGMAAMRMNADMTYDPRVFALSVVTAIIAATAALWAALRLDRFWPAAAASLIVGVAVSGMHYIAMSAMRIMPSASNSSMAMGGATAFGFLLPLVIGITAMAFLLITVIGLSPTEREIREEAVMLARARASGLDI